VELGPVQGALEDVSEWRIKGELCYRTNVDEGRKRVLLIAAAILAARKLSQLDPAKRTCYRRRNYRCGALGGTIAGGD
jgi:hypothetical protein